MMLKGKWQICQEFVLQNYYRILRELKNVCTKKREKTSSLEINAAEAENKVNRTWAKIKNIHSDPPAYLCIFVRTLVVLTSVICIIKTVLNNNQIPTWWVGRFITLFFKLSKQGQLADKKRENKLTLNFFFIEKVFLKIFFSFLFYEFGSQYLFQPQR